MRAAVDTNVLVSAVGWDGPEDRLLRRAVAGEVDLVLGLAVLEEFLEVMARPRFAFVPPDDLASFVALLLRAAVLVHPRRTVDVVRDDPVDNRVLEAAVAGECDLVVSGDRHLLDLGAFEGMDVVRAPEALRRLARSG